MLHRAWARSSTAAATLEQVGEMKEYIEQALANIAYSITHATQKVETGGWVPQSPCQYLLCVQIDDGLRMQSEDLDTAAARVAELAAELDIKQEMRNRATVRSGVDI